MNHLGNQIFTLNIHNDSHEIKYVFDYFMPTHRFTNLLSRKMELYHPIRSIKKFNEKGQKTGTWKHFDHRGKLIKTENYLVPQEEDKETLVIGNNAFERKQHRIVKNQ